MDKENFKNDFSFSFCLHVKPIRLEKVFISVFFIKVYEEICHILT